METTKEQIVDFFTKNVIGRHLKTDDTVYQLEEGKIEGMYSDELFFSNLLTSSTGFCFDMTTITHEKIYYLDNNKKQMGVKKDFTGVSVFHYEFSLRKSTQELTGIMRLTSSTVLDHTMEAVVYGVYGCILKKKELVWKEQQLLYRDMPSIGNKFNPIAIDSKIRLYIENEKLRFEYSPVYYDVNTKTLGRWLSKDRYPIFVSKEI